MFDPTIGSNAAFLAGEQNVTSPRTWTGVTTFFSVGTTAGANTVITPTGNSVMRGLYPGLIVLLGQNTAHFESATVTVVTSSTFTVNATTANHSAGEIIAGSLMTVATVPQNFSATGPITPAYTETLFSNLFYAGEPSAPTAVYTSDPYFPESFTSNYFQSTIYPGTYQPALIGHNDGANGGAITGIRRLGNQMMVYKESALYRLSLVSLYGDMVWQVEIVSPTIGCVAPNSIVSFDTFHVFLGVDGLYLTDGQLVKRIDMNVPTFFDASGTYTGNTVIGTRAISVAGRFGSLYMIFFGVGLGYPSQGLWFDFEQMDSEGYPLAGEIIPVVGTGGISGLASMRGPNDVGTLCVTSSQHNLVGEFSASGATNPGDWGNAIPLSISLQADQFEDYPVEGAIVAHKVIERIILSGGMVYNVGSPVVVTVSVNGGNPAVSGTVTFPLNSDGLVREGMVAVQDTSLDQGQLSDQISITSSGVDPWFLSGVLAEISVQQPVLT
jgi:hypothetical protein